MLRRVLCQRFRIATKFWGQRTFSTTQTFRAGTDKSPGCLETWKHSANNVDLSTHLLTEVTLRTQTPRSCHNSRYRTQGTGGEPGCLATVASLLRSTRPTHDRHIVRAPRTNRLFTQKFNRNDGPEKQAPAPVRYTTHSKAPSHLSSDGSRIGEQPFVADSLQLHMGDDPLLRPASAAWPLISVHTTEPAPLSHGPFRAMQDFRGLGRGVVVLHCPHLDERPEHGFDSV